MKATFIGDCSPNPTCEVFGMSFPPGTAVDVSSLSQAQQEALAANPVFTTKGEPPAPAPTPPAPVAPTATPAAPTPPAPVAPTATPAAPTPPAPVAPTATPAAPTPPATA